MLEIEQETKKQARLTRWKPKKWQPEYDRMVFMSVAGFSNKQIGDRLGYTKEHVSNVLNLAQAEALREEIQKRMREEAYQDLPKRLNEIASKTVERMHMLVHNDDVFERSPFQVIDRGMDILKGLGHLKHGNTDTPALPPGTVVNHGTMVVSDKLMERFVVGLEKSEEARQLNPAENSRIERKASGD